MDKLRQPSDDDRPPLKQLLAQAADLQQRYERDVEQALNDLDPYDAAVLDLVHFIRQHHSAVVNLDVWCGLNHHVVFSGDGEIRYYPPGGYCQRLPIDAPGDR